METNSCNFYANKGKLLQSIFILVGFCIAFLFLIATSDLLDRIIGCIFLIFDAVLIKILLRSLIKVYIEITPTYIKIDNFEKLLWTDITAGKIGSMQSYYLYVKDVSKYKLTFWQKINSVMGAAPFLIALARLSEEDQKKLICILKERIPQNDLD